MGTPYIRAQDHPIQGQKEGAMAYSTSPRKRQRQKGVNGTEGINQKFVHALYAE
jgi:hypothetical protein